MQLCNWYWQPHPTSFGLVLKVGSSGVPKNPARRIKCRAEPCVSSIACLLTSNVCEESAQDTRNTRMGFCTTVSMCKSVKVLRITHSPSHHYCIFFFAPAYCRLLIDAACNYVSVNFKKVRKNGVEETMLEIARLSHIFHLLPPLLPAPPLYILYIYLFFVRVVVCCCYPHIVTMGFPWS